MNLLKSLELTEERAGDGKSENIHSCLKSSETFTL